MRRFIFFALLIIIALDTFGHAGEVHKYMGTVTGIRADGSFMLEKTDGETMHVGVSKATAYRRADGGAAKATDMSAGQRVVVTISTDGKTATEVKLAAEKHSAGN